MTMPWYSRCCLKCHETLIIRPSYNLLVTPSLRWHLTLTTVLQGHRLESPMIKERGLWSKLMLCGRCQLHMQGAPLHATVHWCCLERLFIDFTARRQQLIRLDQGLMKQSGRFITTMLLLTATSDWLYMKLSVELRSEKWSVLSENPLCLRYFTCELIIEA